MAKSDYRPGRRRKPMIAAALDWAAGVLIGILLVLIGVGLAQLVVEPGAERFGAFMTLTFLLWPIGAALGVWLSVGRPFVPRSLAAGLAASGLGVALLMIPSLLGLESELLRALTGVAALVSAPGLARAAILRTRGDD